MQGPVLISTDGGADAEVKLVVPKTSVTHIKLIFTFAGLSFILGYLRDLAQIHGRWIG
jgi:hypothetical protein